MTKILAIDDKEDNLISLSAILKSLISGCTVITALSGAEGIEKAKTESPDTILLDIKMSGMDGYETCKRLKENKEIRHIPVIMISAILTGSNDLIKGLDIGADAYLAKPIDEHVLIAQVKTALRMKTAEDILRRQKDVLEEMVQERTAELTKSIIQMKHEIDERKKTEGMLKEREEKYRSLFEQSNDAIIIHHLNGDIIDFNQRALELLGCDHQQ
ncbi:MAG: response regulator, partial [Desulfobacula sp.]|nr:response regulator [Desulfobacula sp.]